MRRAIIETPMADADAIAAALRPDHTDEMTTEVVDGTIRTEIERPSTGSLQSTTDDYVVNLTVAERVLAILETHEATESDTTDQHTPDDQ